MGGIPWYYVTSIYIKLISVSQLKLCLESWQPVAILGAAFQCSNALLLTNEDEDVERKPYPSG